MARFPATIHAVKVDKEGEARLTLTVPSDSLGLILPFATLTGSLLSVDIEVDPSQR